MAERSIEEFFDTKEEILQKKVKTKDLLIAFVAFLREAFKKKKHFFCDKCHNLGGGWSGSMSQKNHSLKIIFKQF